MKILPGEENWHLCKFIDTIFMFMYLFMACLVERIG